MFNWRSSSAYKVGVGHVEAGTPCQDRAVHISKNGVQAIVLADGAGSYEHSHLGAEATAVFVANRLCDQFDELLAMEEEAIVENLLVDIQSQLNFLALQHDQQLEDFSSTLLFVATKGNQFVSGHVGDGLIVMAENGQVHVLSHPENGRFENETYFVTMSDLGTHFRIYKGAVTENTGFAIMSDGVSCSFYSAESGLDPVNLAIIIQHFQTAAEDTFAKDLDELLEALRENTHDDCSIAVLAAAAEDATVFESTPAVLLTTSASTVQIPQAEAQPDVDLHELLSSNRFEDEGDDEDFDLNSVEFVYDEEDEDSYDYEDEDDSYDEEASEKDEEDLANGGDDDMLLDVEEYDYDSDVDEDYSHFSTDDDEDDETTIVDEVPAAEAPVMSETDEQTKS